MGAVGTIVWACVLCGHCIQSDWACTAMNLHQILNIHPWKLFSEGHSYRQPVIGSFIRTTRLLRHHILCRCFGETSNHPGDTAPLQPKFGVLWLLAFPKLKSPLKGKRFHPINEIQANTMWQMMAMGRTVWGSKVPTLKGIEVSLFCVLCFLYLISSSINVSTFHSTWLDTFWTDLVYLKPHMV